LRNSKIGGLNLQINNRIFYVVSIIFTILGVVSVFLVRMEISAIFLGFSQLFRGLDEYRISQCVDSSMTLKGNKNTSIFSINVGLIIIIIFIIKLIF
jgi:hypothetical protein